MIFHLRFLFVALVSISLGACAASSEKDPEDAGSERDVGLDTNTPDSGEPDTPDSGEPDTPDTDEPDTTDPTCGDGTLDDDEECDNGDNNSDTEPNACRVDCLLYGCGDGVIDSGEVCDVGEANSDTDPNVCRTNCQLPSCGDGIVDTNEVCDDGQNNSNELANACRTNCSIAFCGDDVIDTGEICDDGESNSNSEPDACRSDCSLPTCGDGVIDTEAGEICDDGDDNADNADSCRTNCQYSSCGDGILDSDEECDNGADNNNLTANACRTNCTSATCGDLVVDTGEACDGSNLNGVSCGSIGGDFNGGDLACNSCAFDTENCTIPASCGDGNLDSDDGETCDNGNQNSNAEPNACRTNCLIAFCGDDVEDTGEECDNGTSNSDGLPNACRTTCVQAFCGDGILDTGESCDEGDANSDTTPDACRTDCSLPTCGDGITDDGESCDEGDANSDTTPDACRANCSLPTCGDVVIDTNEDCEGSNLNSATCSSEGYASGMLSCSACAFNFALCGVCGNNTIESGEVCDGTDITDTCETSGFDGGTLSCTNTCTLDMAACTTDTLNLFFSEYIEGSSDNKFLEIYNASLTTADLSLCTIRIFTNGRNEGDSGVIEISLGGSLDGGNTHVLCHSNADDQSACDTPSGALGFNGDDAIDLYCSGETVDSFGRVGEDPGSEWTGGGIGTKDQTLRRNCDVEIGDRIKDNEFDPSAEWSAFPINTFDGINNHCELIAENPTAGEVIITEIMHSADEDWVELHNPSGEDLDLGGCNFDSLNSEMVFSLPNVIHAGEWIAISGFMLLSDEDIIRLSCAENIVDEVEYISVHAGDFPRVDGASLTLNPDHLSTTDNDNGANWCLAIDEYDAPLRGTPGAVNSECPTGSVHWGKIQYPGSTTDINERIYGRVYISGITGTSGSGVTNKAVMQLGVGPQGDDPTTQDTYTWIHATRNDGFSGDGSGNNDEFFAHFPADLSNGTYSYVFRYSYDGGVTWLYGDIDGSDHEDPNGGFQVDQLGTLTLN